MVDNAKITIREGQGKTPWNERLSYGASDFSRLV